MEHLTTRDVRRLFEFLHHLYAMRSHDEFKQELVTGLSTLVSADLYAYNEISARRQLVTGYAIWPIAFPLLKDATEIVGRYQLQHPSVAHYLSSGSEDVTKISDFMSYRQFRRTELHNEFYRPMNIPYGIAFRISLEPDSLIGIGLHRSGKDYTERDRRVLSELHPHIIQAYRNARSVTRMQQGNATMRGVLEDLHSAIVCLSTRLTIQWATPQAERLMARYALFGYWRRDRLSHTATGWLHMQETAFSCQSTAPRVPCPLIIAGPEGTVTIRLIRHGEARFLILEESSASSHATLTMLGLTTRETEILGWIVQGKTNPEIGQILNISPRTVQKHLEHIYVKLGVENRHAAMTVAMEAMRRSRSVNDYD